MLEAAATQSLSFTAGARTTNTFISNERNRTQTEQFSELESGAQYTENEPNESTARHEMEKYKRYTKMLENGER